MSSLNKMKSPSVSSDQYDSLKMDNLAYVNIPEEHQDYLNPMTDDQKQGSNPGPPPPPRDLTQTPPPPIRNISLVSGTGSDDAFSTSPTATDVNKNKTFKQKNIGSITGSPGVKTRVFRKDVGPTEPQQNEKEKVHEKEKVLLRQKNSAFDSGVGDLENIQIEDGRRKTYDYADYGHQYEELPNRKSIVKCNGDSGVDSQYQSSSGATDIGSEAGDMTGIVHNNTEKRKRVNPLYDGMTQSMPSIYSKSKEAKDEGLRRQVRCLKCALIVLVVVSCAALAVAIFAVISHTQTKDDPDPLLTPKVEKLSDNYNRLEQLLSSFEDTNDTLKVLSDLIQRVKGIEGNMSTEVDKLQQQLNTHEQNISHNAQEIVDTHDNISSVIASLNLTVQLQLHNISKQEGPRGRQGVANFTRCSYYNITNDAVASDRFSSYSPWTPTETELETKIAIYTACTVDGGTSAILEIHAIDSQNVQYRCQCAGIVEGKSRRYCNIHILICPRES